jgi:hypothetical protein
MCDRERPCPSRCENDFEADDGVYRCDRVPSLQTSFDGRWFCDHCFSCTFSSINYSCSQVGCLDPAVCLDIPHAAWLCERHGKRCKGALDPPPYAEEMERCIRHGVVDRTDTNGMVYCEHHFEKANELFAKNGNRVPETSWQDEWGYYFFKPEHIDVNYIAPPEKLPVLQERHLLANLDAISTRLDRRCLRCEGLSLRRTKCCRKAICGACLTEIALGIDSWDHELIQYQCPGCRGDIRMIGTSGLEMATNGMKLQD